VYEDWKLRPFAAARRTSTMSALYQDRPSLLLSSMVEKAGFGRAAVGAWNGVPSGSVCGTGTLASVLRSR
jgi:hypothetical protein